MRTRSLRWLLLLAALLPVAVLLAAGLAAALGASADRDRGGHQLRDQIAELRHELQIPGPGGQRPRRVAPRQHSPGAAAVQRGRRQRRDSAFAGARRSTGRAGSQLRGRIDELQNQLQQQTAELGKRIDDLTFLVENPKAAAAAARQAGTAGATSAPPPTGTTTPPLSTGVLGRPARRPPHRQAPAPRAPRERRHAPRSSRCRSSAGAARLPHRRGGRARDPQQQPNLAAGLRRMFLLAQAQAGQRQYSQAALSRRL